MSEGKTPYRRCKKINISLLEWGLVQWLVTQTSQLLTKFVAPRLVLLCDEQLMESRATASRCFIVFLCTCTNPIKDRAAGVPNPPVAYWPCEVNVMQRL